MSNSRNHSHPRDRETQGKATATTWTSSGVGGRHGVSFLLPPSLQSPISLSILPTLSGRQLAKEPRQCSSQVLGSGHLEPLKPSEA